MIPSGSNHDTSNIYMAQSIHLCLDAIVLQRTIIINTTILQTRYTICWFEDLNIIIYDTGRIRYNLDS